MYGISQTEFTVQINHKLQTFSIMDVTDIMVFTSLKIESPKLKPDFKKKEFNNNNNKTKQKVPVGFQVLGPPLCSAAA